MKNILLCFSVFFLLFSCNKNENFKKNLEKQKESEVQKNKNSKYHTKLDTLVIKTENDIILNFEKKKFNKIIDDHPEFFDEMVQSPDTFYTINSSGFGSEAGKDSYYILYAYFLKQRNSVEKYSEQRKKLIKIYSNINSIFSALTYGGTYFAHQEPRILGYTEYSIYLHSLDNDASFKDPYDISKQKKLYLQSLRQLVKDETKIDTESTEEQKIDRSKKIDLLVDELDHLITNIFYLRCAQHFHYEHY